MKEKFHIDWKKGLVFLFVSAGLYFLTRSFTMTLGILLLLIVADFLLADWDDTRKRKREWREFEEELQRRDREQQAGQSPKEGKEQP
jgi:hypothetical protein